MTKEQSDWWLLSRLKLSLYIGVSQHVINKLWMTSDGSLSGSGVNIQPSIQQVQGVCNGMSRRVDLVGLVYI